MKLIGDEHVSPRIIRALHDLALNQKSTAGWTMESARDHFAGSEDEDWVVEFARAGGDGLISADREMLKRHTLIQRIAETGVIGVYVGGAWATADRVRQAAHLLYWWPKIRETFATSERGSAWIVPSGFTDRKDFRAVRPFGRPIAEQGSD